MKFAIICFLFSLEITIILGKVTLCPSVKECECSKSKQKFFVNCQRLANMKELQNIFRKDLNHKPISILRIKRCKISSLPNSVFWNTTIKVIRAQCPFDKMEDDALSPIESLTELNLHHAKFSKIPKAISKLSKLKILLVNDGKISRINTELQNMTELRKLKIIHNHIFQISNETFSKNSNLKLIDLSQNRLIHLYPGTFDGCSELNKIVLQKNSLKSVDGLFTVLKLQEIYLKENNIDSIDNAFHEDIMLKLLDLSSNPLRQISVSAFNSVKQLQTLTLSRCQLKFLHGLVFRSLTKLEKLDLSFNHLESLPLEIFHGISNLLQVDLKENRITYLGNVFSHNRRLESVMLSGNNLKSIGNLFRGLGNLEIVDLKENKLKEITATDFSTTTSLVSLWLTKNHIHRIDSNAFLNTPELKNVTLAYNQLETLNGSFSNTPELEYLVLHHNQLEEIGPSEMSNLKKLRRLNLGNNYLTNIHKAFTNLTRLESLTLNNNRLSTITRTTFPKKFKIKKLFVGGNRWICDCRLLWLLTTMERTNKKLSSLFKCSFPERYMKKKVSHLRAQDFTEWTQCDKSCQCTCVPQENEFFVRVNCSDRKLTQVPVILPKETGELHLQNNLIRNLVNLSSHSLAHLKYLNVEQNLLSKIDFNLPKNLEILKLAKNQLTRFMPYFQPSKLTWTLSSNPWICDCETVQFWKFLTSKSNKILDVNSTKCSQTEGKPNLLGKIISDLSEFELCPEKIILYIYIGVCLSVLTLTAIGCHLVYTKYRYHLKVWLYSRGLSCLKKRDNRDVGKKHDAYLCFNDKDLDFVREHIIPGLEDQKPFYSLFVPPRDMLPGKFELEHQLEEVRNSKRIVVILSQNFIDSELCMEIFRVAFTSGLEEKNYRIIPIVIGTLPPLSELDPVLKVALESTKHFRFGQKLFWQMVRFAMPEKSHLTEVLEGEDDIDMPLLNAW